MTAKDLGQTCDPKELVPDDPEAITSTAAWLKSYGDTLHSTDEGLKRIDTTDGWSGKAGDAFRAAFKGGPRKWLEAGDCFHDAATALTIYKSTLAWAQGQGGDAIRQWNGGRGRGPRPPPTRRRTRHDRPHPHARAPARPGPRGARPCRLCRAEPP
ncbi:WXG100 family type VII secretion target [Streptomyces sp. NBC_00873]|nr:WXG100 family type VII secretion target [Streptomyces sp. NBC_00873]WSY96805.1 WXG100 family type VII secretion target [Streptomyces sp. NBC_00873]WTA41422.1 WXG100 family type VII secretion target [Streptomyces sp. NBC_00842]WTA48475.1 WXG100 family type VII secretion target [Streptomyces sp. NBC_00842]